MSQKSDQTIPAAIARQIDLATLEMTEKERVLFLRGVTFGLRAASTAMQEALTAIRNAVPSLLDGPVTVRRIGI